MWGHAVPEAPEIFERGVTLSVKEGVLQAVGLVASRAIGDIHHMPRLAPFTLAHHRHKGIFLAFPGHPIVPTNVGPGERFITNIKLRLECEFFFSSRRRHTRYIGDWSSDVCSSDLGSAGTRPRETASRRARSRCRCRSDSGRCRS